MRWGIISTGKIANDFALAITKAGGVVQAVASRSLENAEEFASRHGAVKAYGSYQELYQDGEVDVVYVGTPHSHHYECVMGGLEGGKAVVCEKPMCPTLAQTERCVAKAREKKLFLMEGVWTRFFPVTKRVRHLVDTELGPVRNIHSTFGFDAGSGRTGRLFEPRLAGGALLDVGVYPLNWVTMLLGEPETITATGIVCETGVDEYVSATLKYKSGATAQIVCGVTSPLPNESYAACKNGVVTVRAPSHCPDTLEVTATTPETHPLDPPHNGVIPGYNFAGSQGFTYEVTAVEKAVSEGKIECEEIPLEDTLIVARVCHEIRRQLGVVYPFDEE